MKIVLKLINNTTICAFVLWNLSACSFKAKKDQTDATQAQVQVEGKPLSEQQRIESEKSLDSDGDQQNDYEEKKQGRNPFIADLPQLEVQFLQNYKIVARNADNQFILDTKVAKNDPKFRYQVGLPFIQKNALQTAAKVGKFSGHTQGEIFPHDLTWVTPPQMDSSFLQKKYLEFTKTFSQNDPIELRLEFENTIRLKPNPYFKSIKNITLNFYYYDYQIQEWILLKTYKDNRTIVPGNTEIISITIEQLPINLLNDDYFQRGQLIVSEIVDFELPDLKTNYQELMKAIQAKSIPVVINTPQEFRIVYVGTNGDKKNFSSILSLALENNIQIENNEIKRLGSFENNLADYTYLKDVSKEDKKGKWFVLTTPFAEHYTDHLYGPKDYLVLTYATGTALGKQSEEIWSGLFQEIDSGDNELRVNLGQVAQNSKIEVEIEPIKIFGQRVTTEKKDFHERPQNCGRNRICGVLELDCLVDINTITNFDGPFSFNNQTSSELENISFFINGKNISIKEIIEKKAGDIEFDQKNIHVTIDDLALVADIFVDKENPIFLIIKSKRKSVHQGARMHDSDGRDRHLCPQIVGGMAIQSKIPISLSSKDIESFKPLVSQGLVFLPDQIIREEMQVNVVSSITQYFN